MTSEKLFNIFSDISTDFIFRLFSTDNNYLGYDLAVLKKKKKKDKNTNALNTIMEFMLNE